MSPGASLSMRGISKRFPGVRALHEVDFELAPGEIHGLVGENGAGKSTLMKVLGGVYLPDEGTIEIRGETRQIRHPRDALAAGITVIYQEFNLVPAMTVAENIFLGREPRTRLGLPDRPRMKAESLRVLERLGFVDLDPGMSVRRLSTAHQQAVEIAKALVNDTSILVMDEPTSVLTKDESEVLFRIIESLRSSGKSIVFISHRLEEVRRLCDRVTVLRDGVLVSTLDNARRDLDADELVRLMVGRIIQDYFPGRKNSDGEVLLEARGMTSPGLFEDVSLTIRRGEILGMYGLVGAGRTEIAKGMAGLLPLSGGSVRLGGKPIAKVLPMVPEDRKREGLVLGMSLGDNIALPNLNAISRRGVVQGSRRRRLVADFVDRLNIRPADPERKAVHYSGGNQQKAVIAKWLASRPEVVIFDEPTRGIDVGAKAEIYRILARMADEGTGILMISSELLEVLGMSDRIAVVRKGRVRCILDRDQADEETLVRIASGLEVSPRSGGAYA